MNERHTARGHSFHSFTLIHFTNSLLHSNFSIILKYNFVLFPVLTVIQQTRGVTVSSKYISFHIIRQNYCICYLLYCQLGIIHDFPNKVFGFRHMSRFYSSVLFDIGITVMMADTWPLTGTSEQDSGWKVLYICLHEENNILLEYQDTPILIR